MILKFAGSWWFESIKDKLVDPKIKDKQGKKTRFYEMNA